MPLPHVRGTVRALQYLPLGVLSVPFASEPYDSHGQLAFIPRQKRPLARAQALKGLRSQRALLLRRHLHGRDDLRVGTAAAQIASEIVPNVVLARVRI